MGAMENFMFHLLAVFFLLVLPVVANAVGEGIPVGFLFSQIFNFSLFVLILFFILKKKLSSFLKQKRADFLEYRKNAKALEQKYQSDCLAEQNKIQLLIDKQKNIKANVKEAIHRKEKEMTEELEHRLKSSKTRADQELKRLSLKNINQLKTGFLFHIMSQTKRQLKDTESTKKEVLSSQIVQKWEQI